MKTMNKVNTVEKVDLSNYTSKQKQSLQKGYEIWCSGCLSGDWEDEEFRNNNTDNSDWVFFNSVFRDVLDLNNWDVIKILKNTFSGIESKKPTNKDYIGYSFWKNLRGGNFGIDISPIVDLVIKKYEENKIPYLRSEIEDKVWSKLHRNRYDVMEYLF